MNLLSQNTINAYPQDLSVGQLWDNSFCVPTLTTSSSAAPQNTILLLHSPMLDILKALNQYFWTGVTTF